jgi:hypothetical protein
MAQQLKHAQTALEGGNVVFPLLRTHEAARLTKMKIEFNT